MSKKLKIKLKKSLIGKNEKQRTVIRTLGLRKTNSVVYHTDTPQIRGMVKMVSFMLDIEEVDKT